MEGDKGPVCVTGGTGFIGSSLIKRLLDRGYYVRTTVRSNAEQKKDTSFLTSLPGASEKLQIFNADLSDPESFNAPIEGCIGVFHVATPVDLEDREPEEIVTKRAISGALGILQACLNSKTVKRVVYTSSASAVVFNGEEADEMDERFWSDVDFLKALKPFGSYMISKTLTEKAVLEFGEKHGLDVVTIIPSFVVGPFICPKLPGSVRSTLAMVFGDKDQYSVLINICMVHVDDVARAHIFLLECPTAEGSSLEEIRGNKIPSQSSKKLLDSGFKYKYGLSEMFDEAIQCCKEKGYL
ncbi:vestitone reductase-like isoform X2 [Alnus glutinosa]|uniref:vestitone reductase-like isoform X2 n=1 Tax=Alnus glutinosa TaxID=3517 RepID=UPI002D795896|nr:vestitone reductase-like isoform X2 [Alnus glutinosa]